MQPNEFVLNLGKHCWPGDVWIPNLRKRPVNLDSLARLLGTKSPFCADGTYLPASASNFASPPTNTERLSNTPVQP